MDLKIVRKVNENGKKATLPTKATEHSAGYDLYAFIDEDILVAPKQIVKISTGISIEIPDQNMVGLIYGRSGLGIKHGITLSNCVGVIDSDYRGEIIVGIINNSDKEYMVHSNDRIAQLVITPIINLSLTEAESLSETNRGENGFGSSGK
jgi:dUTP pyrophosphatase